MGCRVVGCVKGVLLKGCSKVLIFEKLYIPLHPRLVKTNV